MIAMRAICVSLTVLAAACSQPSDSVAKTLSKGEFRDAVAAEISKSHPTLCVEKPNDTTINVGRTRESCKEATVSTTYVYQQYVSDPGNLKTYVGGLIASASSAIQTLDQTPFAPEPTRLVVAIRPSAYADSMRADASGVGAIWRPFVGDLITVLMQKDGDLSRSISTDDLKKIALTETAAWELAIKNTSSQIGPLNRSPNADGAEVVNANSGLATSQLLLPETCKKGGSNFDAFVVARDTYFYADQKLTAATSMLAGYAGQLLRDGQSTYSDNLISCVDGNWYASAFDGQNTWRPIPQP